MLKIDNMNIKGNTISVILASEKRKKDEYR